MSTTLDGTISLQPNEFFEDLGLTESFGTSGDDDLIGKADQITWGLAGNDQLANSIRNELHSRHKNSKYLLQETKSLKEREYILYNIEVKSLKSVIQEWLPEVSKLNDNWHLGKQETYEIFTKLKNDLFLQESIYIQYS